MKKPNIQTQKARALRRWVTAPEDLLWQALRNRQLANLKFRRKAPVGENIVDFICLQAGLIVEVEGKGHFRFLREQRHGALMQLGYGVLYLKRERVLGCLPQVLREIEQAAMSRL